MHIQPPPPFPLRLITHNVRYSPSQLSPGEAPWAVRLPLLSAHLQYHTRHIATSIICLQEALHHQWLDILAALNAAGPVRPQWCYIGVGRDDGDKTGEYAPILYRREVYNVLQAQTRWLSSTPDRAGSKGWDAASVRICTEAHFAHVESGSEFVVHNTHLDDQGAVARREGARLVRRWAEERMKGGLVVVVCGDLNSEKIGEAYQVFTGKGSELVDVETAVDEGQKYGERWTFTGFEGKAEERQRLDYIFVGAATRQGAIGCIREQESHWNVSGYAVLPNRFDNGNYHSDHRAVIADIELL